MNYKLLSTIAVALLIVLCTTANAQTTSKFDFVPGEKVIFYDDFSQENIGDFPVMWNTNGSGEIVTSANYPGKWLQLTKQGYFIPEATDDFTDNYTIEFDIVFQSTTGDNNVVGIEFYLLSTDLKNPASGSQPGQAGFRMRPEYDNLFWNNWSEAREWQGDDGGVKFTFNTTDKYHFAIWVQKQRVRVYANESKVLDAPKALQAGYKYNVFRTELFSEDYSPLISNFRIAAGIPDLRNKLITEGKLVSYGIYFDVNKDEVKPESFATLKDIAQVLSENPTIRISVIGHTDADGDNAANLDLSKRRAAAVKAYLVKNFNADATRIETDGKGESEPVADNNTSVNKAKNRRVEFIKL
ncbi:MAG TPA: OmpA family protein [Prolixibacteraceae bacterium]|nr:OmpA family protein [Prolixibacteraceae bacterium]